MIRTVEFDCETQSPLNGAQGITRGARMARARFKDAQQAATVRALTLAFRIPPPPTLPDGSPNKWRVRFTRIAVGIMDPGMPIEGTALRTCSDGPFKAIQDALAEWCGEKDERKPPWSAWDYRQEQPTKERFGPDARFVMRVRIEIEDLVPGGQIYQSLPETHSAGKGAKYRMKRRITAAKKKAAKPTTTPKRTRKSA